MAVVMSRIIARFDDFESFERALGALKSAGVESYEAYGPTNLAHLEHLMPEELPEVRARGSVAAFLKSLSYLARRVLAGSTGSPVRFHATAGAITGLVVFFGMCVLTSLIFNLVVGGKPPVSNLPYVIPAYEGTILLGAIGAFLAVLWTTKLIRGSRVPDNYDPRFSSDTYGIDVACMPGRAESAKELLRNAGAVDINEY